MTSRAGAELVEAARTLREAVSALHFSAPVACVYNPLQYAWDPHQAYLRKYGSGPKSVLFLGMNPGPFGMAQTGVPFGDVASVRDWLGISGNVGKPDCEHPSRRVAGFECPRCEVSGRRLWGLFRETFPKPEAFFQEHFVTNYCPLAFLEQSGRNRTPDKLAAKEKEALYKLCDEHLARSVKFFRASWVIGIGDFAAKRASAALEGSGVQIGRILHPSPACPAANKDWAGQAAKQLRSLGVWPA